MTNNYTCTQDDLDRFWSKVDKTDGCWEWTGSTRNEYGTFWLNGTVVSAHILSFVLVNGLPENDVLHRCDNPPCVRPSCLFDGTHQENMDDMYAKGRRRHKKPKVLRPRKVRKLSVEDVDDILYLLKTPYWGQVTAIAKTYGVSKSVISQIKTGAWYPAESTCISSKY